MDLYTRMDVDPLSIRFVESYENANLYIKIVKNETLIILLYVDDLFVIGVE